MIAIKKYFYIIVFSFLTSCSTTEVRNSYEKAEKNFNFYQNIASQYTFESDWWQEYNIIGLNTLIALGLKNNSDLIKAGLSTKNALYEAKLAGSQLMPDFSGTWESSASKRGSQNSSISHAAQLMISYEVDLWGKLSNAASAKEWEYKATKEDLESTRLTLINNIINTYFALAYLNDSIDIIKNNINYYTKIKIIAMNKFKYGTGDKLNVEEAQNSLLEAEKSLITYSSEKKIQEQTLKNLLNLKPNENLAVFPKNILLVEAIEVNLDVPLSIIAARPDIKAYEYRLKSYFKNFESSEESLYPSITLDSSLTYSNEKLRKTFTVPTKAGSININLPFLNWHKVKWNVKIDQTLYEEALVNFESGITTALNEIDTNYSLYLYKKAEYKNIYETFLTDIKISRYYEERYYGGVSELREWLSALALKNTSELNLLSIKYDLLVSEAKIYQSIAGKAVKKYNF